MSEPRSDFEETMGDFRQEMGICPVCDDRVAQAEIVFEDKDARVRRISVCQECGLSLINAKLYISL